MHIPVIVETRSDATNCPLLSAHPFLSTGCYFSLRKCLQNSGMQTVRQVSPIPAGQMQRNPMVCCIMRYYQCQTHWLRWKGDPAKKILVLYPAWLIVATEHISQIPGQVLALLRDLTISGIRHRKAIP